jgi:hypothetical protein
MIYADAWILEFLKNNMVSLVFLYAIFKQVFPDSMILKAIGDAFKGTFHSLINFDRKGSI